MDKIIIRNLEIYANHGVLPWENLLGQTFIVSAEMEVDIHEAASTDDLDKTVNYAEVARKITELMQSETNKLIETCAEHIADMVLLMDDRIQGVKITVSKPDAPVGLPFETVAVQCERRRHEAYIALGSNLGDSEQLIREAIKKLGEVHGTTVDKVSTLIETKPYGVTDQPNFINGACKITTTLTPHELLAEINRIEQEAGRERLIHWGPRTLDLDILLYDDLILEDDDLCIPHVDMLSRDFVLIPMKEIAPYKLHPVARRRMVEL